MSSARFDQSAARLGPSADFDAACRLADALRNGGWLEPIVIDGVPVEPGEQAFGDLYAMGWRHYALDGVAYERRTLLFGGPLVMALAWTASSLGNRRRRREAERVAGPQWRPLGVLRIVVTSQRLLVCFEQTWCSVWYSAIADMRSDLANHSLELTFTADAPYRLVGPQVPPLSVVLAHQVLGEMQTPAFRSAR